MLGSCTKLNLIMMYKIQCDEERSKHIKDDERFFVSQFLGEQISKNLIARDEENKSKKLFTRNCNFGQSF